MKERIGPKALFEHWQKHLPENAQALVDMPRLAAQFFRDAEAGTLTVRLESAQLDALREEIRKGNRFRFVAFLLGAALLALVLFLK